MIGAILAHCGVAGAAYQSPRPLIGELLVGCYLTVVNLVRAVTSGSATVTQRPDGAGVRGLGRVGGLRPTVRVTATVAAG